VRRTVKARGLNTFYKGLDLSYWWEPSDGVYRGIGPPDWRPLHRRELLAVGARNIPERQWWWGWGAPAPPNSSAIQIGISATITISSATPVLAKMRAWSVNVRRDSKKPPLIKRLLTDFFAPIIARYGVAADVAIHTAHDDRNIHAHVLLTHREFGPDDFGEIANTRTITRKRKGRLVLEKIARNWGDTALSR